MFIKDFRDEYRLAKKHYGVRGPRLVLAMVAQTYVGWRMSRTFWN